MTATSSSIAVIGAGAAGLTAAHLLQKRYRVTLFEKEKRLGGHVNTVEVPEGPAVDTGFIVYNDRNYPTLNRLFEDLDIQGQPSDMSFSYHCRLTRFQYNGSNLNTLFGQRRNLFRPSFIRFLREIMRFNRQAKDDLQQDRVNGASLGEYLAEHRYDQEMVTRYIVPMGAAIWSTSLSSMLDFPARNFIRFFENHGLLDIKDRPQWYTVPQGAQRYVQRIRERFSGEIISGCPIRGVAHEQGKARLRLDQGETRVFDHVVLASHANESLSLLEDASETERRLLGTWRYSDNHAVLHSDRKVMPSLRRVWASWNVARHREDADQAPVCMTYHMNRLQRLQSREDYFVSLNHQGPLDDRRIIREMHYTHPLFTRQAMASQEQLPRLNQDGVRYFCGSYFGHGFHEDAVKSGAQVARSFGVSL